MIPAVFPQIPHFRTSALRFVQSFCLILLFLTLTACGGRSPSVSLSPSGDTIKKAIILQVKHSQTALSQKLNATNPNLHISHVKVRQLDSQYLAKLPTYHLQGRYDLELELPTQTVKQSGNSFDIYLQRQREGKTWRWLQPEHPSAEEAGESVQHWLTYLIH